MSKTVTIPSNVNWLEICLNGKRFNYQGGATVSVPDEVADLLSNNQKNEPSGVRDTGETNNGGLVQENEDAIIVKTDAMGKLQLAADDAQEARIIHFSVDGQGNVTADKTKTQIAVICRKEKAVFGLLNGMVLPYHDRTGSVITFQGSYADPSTGAMTATTIKVDLLDDITMSSVSAGGGGGVLAVSISEQDVMDKTWQEIHDAAFAVVKITPDEKTVYWCVPSVYYSSGAYKVDFYVPGSGDAFSFLTESATGYPALDENPK